MGASPEEIRPKSPSPLLIESPRTYLIPPTTNCDSLWEMLSTRKARLEADYVAALCVAWY